LLLKEFFGGGTPFAPFIQTAFLGRLILGGRPKIETWFRRRMIPPDFEIIQDCSGWRQSPLEGILLKMNAGLYRGEWLRISHFKPGL
jgi:hypothetical protein